jgi:hypothetical protein
MESSKDGCGIGCHCKSYALAPWEAMTFSSPEKGTCGLGHFAVNMDDLEVKRFSLTRFI